MAAVDFTDFYILYKDHPRYVTKELIEDEVINVIIQKYEMVLFTNKGEVLGDPNFGANLPELLFQTKVSDKYSIEETCHPTALNYLPATIYVQWPKELHAPRSKCTAN